MAPHYKVIYFNITGLGEAIRFLLSYGGVDFEDERINYDEWSPLKPKFPLGQLPVLEIDGKLYNQSLSICRYLGRLFNLAGANALEDYEIDNVADTVQDFRLAVAKFFWEADETRKQTLKESFMSTTAPLYLGKLDEIAKKNNGYFVGGKLTWIDLQFASLYDLFNHWLGYDIGEKYPNLAAVKDNVYNLPAIKAWLAKRPKTEF